MKSIRTYLVPSLLVGSTLLLAFWLVMATRSSQWVKGYDLTAKEFVSFRPAIPGWSVRMLPVDLENSTDPNVLAMQLVGESSQAGFAPRFMVRLVHGYNMPMCMKLKYYTVEKLQDHNVRTVSDPKLQSAFRTLSSSCTSCPLMLKPVSPAVRGEEVSREAAKGAKGGDSNMDIQDIQDREGTDSPKQPIPFQLWRLTSGTGVVSLWVTTMIRSGDFATTEEDICSMAFPRVETPDDPNWVPRGLALEDLKHPRVAFQRWWHNRWDGARWDVLTFLRLRPPVYGSEELLSYVTKSAVPEVTPENEATVTKDLLNTHTAMLKELQQWRRDRK